MNEEKEAFAQFRKELNAKGRPGVMIYLCPKCNQVVKSVPTIINKLNEWAFDKNDTSYEWDGRGCCF